MTDRPQPAPNATAQPLARVLPAEAYPPESDDAGRDRIDAVLRSAAHLIPTVPGTYVDSEGDPWVLDEENRWTDGQGVRRPATHTPILGLILTTFGPLVPAATT